MIAALSANHLGALTLPLAPLAKTARHAQRRSGADQIAQANGIAPENPPVLVVFRHSWIIAIRPWCDKGRNLATGPSLCPPEREALQS